MPRPGPGDSPEYYHAYISHVEEEDVIGVLEQNLTETLRLIRPIGEDQALFRYAPGKWSIKEVVGHLIDCERIFGYRALRFARGDATPLSGFDQDAYVVQGAFDRRALRDLVAEFAHLRRANLAFFQSLSELDWEQRGTANNGLVTVRALAFIMAGHDRHHRSVISERYL